MYVWRRIGQLVCLHMLKGGNAAGICRLFTDSRSDLWSPEQHPCSVCVTFGLYECPMTTDIHHAFLIRWQENSSQTRWQAVVENAYTGEKQHFADKEALKRFLSQALFEGDASVSIEENAEAGLSNKCD